MSLLPPSEKPVAQVVSRRHPLAFAMYVMVLCMGLIFVFQWFGAGQTEDALFPGVPDWIIEVWKWEMVLGAGTSLFGLISPARAAPKWPDLADLLHLESIGAFVSGCGLAVYAVSALYVSGLSQAAPGLVLFLVLIAGHVWRGAQAIREAKRLELLVKVMDALGEGGRE